MRCLENLILRFIILFYISNSVVLGENVESDVKLVSRILFGTPASIKLYPFFVQIEVGGRHHCGAAIISDRWLLTAAHCMSNQESPVFVVGAGKNYDGYRLAADFFVTHPDYIHIPEKFLKNDIALVRLTSTLQFSEKVQPINLPITHEVKRPLIGLGKGRNEYGVSPPRLMQVDLMEVDLRHCGLNLIDYYDWICVTRSYIPNVNICDGDSGSPLVNFADSNATIVGIASFIQHSECIYNHYSAFVRVIHYVPWIQKTMTLYSIF